MPSTLENIDKTGSAGGLLAWFRLIDLRGGGGVLVEHEVAAPLNSGEEIFVVELGEVHLDEPVRTYLKVWCSYSELTNTVTLCSPDLRHPETSHLVVVYADGSPDRTVRAYSDGKLTNDFFDGRFLLSCQLSLRKFSQALIDEAIALGFNVAVRTNPPKVSLEDFARLSAVYREGKFEEFYNPEKKYDEACRIVPFDSVFYGEIYLSGNEYFANVIGSSHDPHVASKSWIALWRDQFGNAPVCSSWQFGGFPCDQRGAVGGHVILGTTANYVNAGANMTVFIIPICHTHNMNDNVYMSPLTTRVGVLLNNYNN